MINRVPTWESRERIPNNVLFPIATASFPWEAETSAPISFDVCNVLNVEALDYYRTPGRMADYSIRGTSLVMYRIEILLVNNDDCG